MKNKWFAQNLLEWYEENKRDLPWRSTKNPYFIWLSEIILQQTRVNQGLPYYNRFVERFKTIGDLAKASEQEVLRLWEGLGYYSRGRNLLFTAQFISNELKGKFPNRYEGLIKLKGIGPYTASAIASFAFNEKVAVVDGNVFRVLARVFGISTDIQSLQGKKEFLELAQKLLPDEQVDIYNQAIMEFGALYCVPQNPKCEDCIFVKRCIAFKTDRISELPVKTKKIKTRIRYFHYFIFRYKNQIAMRIRIEKDIWKGLYEFYLIEKENKDPLKKNTFSFLKKPQLQKIYEAKHILSHQVIQATFWEIKVSNKEMESIISTTDLDFYSISKTIELPKPILLANYINQFIQSK